MNDFEYDCLQKKRLIKQSVYHKKGKRKCSLLSDYLTPKQWKERCGAVVSINMNRPVDWNTFKQLDKSTQEIYINHLIEAYQVNTTSLSAMFQIQPLSVRRYFQANGLKIRFPVGRYMNEEQKAAWQNFLSSFTSTSQEEAATTPLPALEPIGVPDIAKESEQASSLPNQALSVPTVEAIASPNSAAVSAPCPPMSMKKIFLCFSGQIDITAVCDTLRTILGNSVAGEIEITGNLSEKAFIQP